MSNESTSLFGLAGKNPKFNDPFYMDANAYIPTDLATMLDFARFLFYMNPHYQEASKRVIAHFITDLEFSGEEGDKEEKERLHDMLVDDLHLMEELVNLGAEWSACFQGDTRVPTSEGAYAIRDLAGKTVHVINRDGEFVPAEFRSFGVQRLVEIELKDGQKFLTTASHRWEVRNSSGKRVVKTTDELNLGCTVPRSAFVGRPAKNDEYLAGVRHGFIFGDGCRENQHKPYKTTRACFVGEKDKAIMPFFEDHHNPIRRRKDETRYEMNFQCGHPGHYKELPDVEASPSYWYGFVCGFIAADGHVDHRDGCVALSQSRRYVLEAVMVQLPRIGMVATSLGGPFEHTPVFTDKKGKTHTSGLCESFTLLLMRNFMRSEDFLITAHRENFEARHRPDSKYGQYVGIRSIKDTGREEEVFCCVEPKTHTFTIGNGVLTSNCGNAFARLHFPFDRMLVDERDGKTSFYSLDRFGDKARFNLQKMEYEVPDPRSKDPMARVWLPFRDHRSTDFKRIKIRFLDPQRIILRHSAISGSTDIIYRFEEWLLRDIKAGRLHQVNETPICMLKAMQGSNDFLFGRDQVFHLRNPTLTGISNGGWGLPPTITNYRSLHMLQIYRKIDESVGRDYMLPFRIMSPNANPNQAGDASMFQRMVEWQAEMAQIIKNHRKDPTSIHSTAFPVTYQEVGGNGKALAPSENVAFYEDSMLDGMGYPAELFHGTMAMPNMPTAIRLFENSFGFLRLGLNNFVRWVSDRVQRYQNVEAIEVGLESPTLADNLEKQYLYMQLAAAGEISRTKAFKAIGISDPVEEAKTRIDEDLEIEKAKQEKQTEYQREMASGDSSSDPSQGGGGGGSAVTPTDLMSQGQQIAQQWASMDEGDRRKAMQSLESTNPALYATAKESLETARDQGASQGRKQVTGGDQQPPSGGAA